MAATLSSISAQPVRLVIWDLDDTFWHGTLSEGGISARPAACQAVGELARRGIISSICSKNNLAAAEAELRRLEMWQYFVFPDFGWDAKGGRLRALIARCKLRPQNVLFIDDSAQNLAEAQHFVPGIQVAGSRHVDCLLTDPRCAGTPDPGMSRLLQYRALETRTQAQNAGCAGNQAFLRDSAITIHIDHDVTAHLDRAIELINRTNQLNFTKDRLPQDLDAARAKLSGLLKNYLIQAGLISVRDRYGDYGICGFYALYNDADRPRTLVHFCFSCRILGMGIETFLYRLLGRPVLHIKGEVAANPVEESGDIDWITLCGDPEQESAAAQPRLLDYVLARGSCDVRPIAQYFRGSAQRVIEELHRVDHGRIMVSNSLLLAAQAIDGMPAEFCDSLLDFGFAREDLTSLVVAPPKARRAIWVLSFVLDDSHVFRHRATGLLMPLVLQDYDARPGPVKTGDLANLEFGKASMLAAQFDYIGRTPDSIFRDALHKLLAQAPPGVGIFILLRNVEYRGQDGAWRSDQPAQQRNLLIRDIAANFAGVQVMSPADFMTASEREAMPDINHFERLVYFKMYRHILAHLPPAIAAENQISLILPQTIKKPWWRSLFEQKPACIPHL